MLNILITGGGGQLGHALAEASRNSHNRYITLTHNDLDICNRSSVAEVLQHHHTDVVINCAAYTDVERGEDDKVQMQRINVEGVETLSAECYKQGVKLIHISTDYVFGGDNTRTTPYREEDATAPINGYGHSKAEGERRALNNPEAVILRTSWLYSPYNKNFCRTILRLADREEQLRVVDDQYGTPTSALTLSRNIVEIIDNGEIDKMAGIYHLTDGGYCSWYEFAQEIVRQSGKICSIEPCKSSQRITRAQRPTYSVLDTTRISRIRGITIIDWREALSECITEINRLCQ